MIQRRRRIVVEVKGADTVVDVCGGAADDQLTAVDIAPGATLVALDQVQRGSAAASEGGSETTTDIR